MGKLAEFCKDERMGAFLLLLLVNDVTVQTAGRSLRARRARGRAGPARRARGLAASAGLGHVGNDRRDALRGQAQALAGGMTASRYFSRRLAGQPRQFADGERLRPRHTGEDLLALLGGD
jgi:hypothetical protein